MLRFCILQPVENYEVVTHRKVFSADGTILTMKADVRLHQAISVMIPGEGP